MRTTGAATIDNFSASALTVTPQTLPFTDTFTSATNAQLNSIAWTNQAGVFGVAGGNATAPAGVGIATVNGVSAANTTVQASVAVASPGRSAGLLARYSGPGDANYYLAELVNDGALIRARIWRNLNGGYALLASGVAPANAGVLSFNVSGSSLILSLDGNVLATATDSALASGSVGLRGAAGATFDNFSAN
jgi:hypothetical protein